MSHRPRSFVPPHRFVPLIAAALFAALAAATARADTTLLDETFATDPIGTRAIVDGDSGRFTYHAGTSLTAAYDTSLPTTKLAWSLGGGSVTLTDADSFRYSVAFSIDGSTLVAPDDQFAQLSFGLINSTTTGDDRAGGTFDDAQGAYDIVTVDYFPNVSPLFGGPTLGATIVINNGNQYLADFGSPFDPGSIRFPFGASTDQSAEGPLPTDVTLTAVVDWDAATRTLTLTIADAGGLLSINLDGGGDVHTITQVLAAGEHFSVDRFALTLWEDTFAFPAGTKSAAADITFTHLLVEATAAVPEPASAALLGVATLIAAGRRRRGR